MAEKIKLITHTDISGDMDLNIPQRTTFKLSPYKLSTGKIVGEFTCTPEQLKEIQKSDKWEKTYIQFRDDNAGAAESTNPDNRVHVGTVINPLGFSSQQVQLIENALLVKPELREILADNVLDACNKILDAENLPPKKDKTAPKDVVLPSNEGILAMDKKGLTKALKDFGGKYDTKADETANKNALMDLVDAKRPTEEGS